MIPAPSSKILRVKLQGHHRLNNFNVRDNTYLLLILPDTRIIEIFRPFFSETDRNCRIGLLQRLCVSSFVNIIDCLATVVGREHNCLFSYRTVTTGQLLLGMVGVFIQYGLIR